MSNSPPSSPSERGGGGAEGGGGDGGEEEIVGGPIDIGDPRICDPSSSRPRSAEAVWPEHFLEAVAAHVAVDATRTGGRIAAAPAIATVFQVCSTWRSVSRSELLWEEVTRRVWSGLHVPVPPSTWRNEFVRLHRTAHNFRSCRYTYSVIPDANIPCRRLALSEGHLAAGFIDGTVRIFQLPSAQLVAFFGSDPQRARLGRFSESISGLFLLPCSDRLIFASQDGDVHVAPLSGSVARRAHVGNPMDDGPLIDFDGNGRWWVGLFAGVPGCSWHVWDGVTEQLLYIGGSLTDPDSVSGWRLLAEFGAPTVGRVRIPDLGVAVGCTSSRIQVLDLDNDTGSVVGEFEFPRSVKVDLMDACDGRVMVVDQREMARVRIARSLEEVCRFSTARRWDVQQQQSQRRRGDSDKSSGCMNWGYAVVCYGGEIRVWDVVSGEYLYKFREDVGIAGVITASYRYVSAWSEDTGLHLWDFEAV